MSSRVQSRDLKCCYTKMISLTLLNKHYWRCFDYAQHDIVRVILSESVAVIEESQIQHIVPVISSLTGSPQNNLFVGYKEKSPTPFIEQNKTLSLQIKIPPHTQQPFYSGISKHSPRSLDYARDDTLYFYSEPCCHLSTAFVMLSVVQRSRNISNFAC